MKSRDEFLEMKKKNTERRDVFVEMKQTIDKETGEILSEQKTTVGRATKEPNYIKVYYETMLAFNQINNLPVSFTLSLSKFLEWTNDGKPMVVTLNKRVKDIMQVDCGVKLAQINRYITTSIKSGLLFKTEYRGVYEVNPFMIARGKWESIQKLQCKFDFVNGIWVREVEEKESEPNLETGKEKSVA